jgi:HEAT repeat protein
MRRCSPLGAAVCAGVLLGWMAVNGCAKPQPPVAKAPATRPAPAPALEPPTAADRVEDQRVADAPIELPPAEPAPAVVEQAPPPAAAVGIDALREALANAGDPESKALAIDGLARLGKAAAPAMADLVAAAADPDPLPRWHAARALGLVGPAAAQAVPTLVGLLGDADPLVATQAAHAVGLVADRDTVDLEPLLAAALHADPRVRRAAVLSLRRLSTPQTLAPLVGRHLADADPSVVIPALETLADMGEESVPMIVEALGRPDTRYWATVAAAEIGPAAAPATERLADLAVSGEYDERLQAMFALGAIGPAAVAAVPALVNVLDQDEELLKFAAAAALGQIGDAAADESLERAGDSDNPFLAAIASWARARIHPDDGRLVAAAVGRLMPLLGSGEPGIRATAVHALSDLAPSLDADATATLTNRYVELLDDPDTVVGTAAGAALVRHGPAAAAALRTALADPANRIRALEILAAQGPEAAGLQDELIAALGDDDAAVASEAAVALAAIGRDAAAAVPRLTQLLGATTPPPVRLAAAYALGSMGPAAAAANERLRDLARSDDDMEATVAIWAAVKIDPQDASLFASAVPLLERALGSDRELARYEAAVALGDMGAAAAAAAPLLEVVAADDPSRTVREAAAAALGRIALP